jgi:AraC-like DNA-binding protein
MKARYEPIISLGPSSFNVAIQEKKEFDYPWHYHPEYELTYILSSHGGRYVGNSIENFEKDDLVLLGPNLPHCWKNIGHQQNPASAIVVQWKEEFIGREWINAREFDAIRRLLELSNKGIKFNRSIALKVKEKFFKLLKLPPFEKLILFLQVLQELAQTEQYHILCEQSFSHRLNHIENERINTVYQYIKNNYHEKITLADIAARVNMSEEYFSRFFSQIMKKPFFLFLNEYRITMACKLLIETDMQVAEVCYSSGYESIPFFYRQFKKFKGYTPLAYKSHYQKIFPKESR